MHTRLLVSTGVGAALAAAFCLPAGAAPAEKPSCTGITAQKRGSTLLTYRLRCNFQVDRLGVRSSMPIRRAGTPRLDGARPGDRLRCSRRSRSLATCRGTVSRDVRIREALRVEGRWCEDAKFRLRAEGPEEASFVLTILRTGPC
jgi:hypothetical protein